MRWCLLKTAELIDEEAKNMVEASYARAKEILESHKEQHRQVAELLLEREVIFSDDLERILGKRPWSEEEDAPAPSEENKETAAETRKRRECLKGLPRFLPIKLKDYERLDCRF